MTATKRHIEGAVTLVTSYGFGYHGLASVREDFSSIDALAVRMSLSCLRPSSGADIVDTVGRAVDERFWSEGFFRIHVVLDGDGLPIDSWKVITELRRHEKERREWWHRESARRRGWNRLPEERFRDGPIPLRERWNTHLRGLYKAVGTFQEARAADALSHDDDAIDAGIRVRGKRSRSMIGDNDREGTQSMRHHDCGWKRHRATQWKNVRS